jgi:hypothetical protein
MSGQSDRKSGAPDIFLKLQLYRNRETVYSGLGTNTRQHMDRHMNRMTAGLGKVHYELS